MTELIASYPYGEQLCLAVTPDHARTFVAEGAVIAVLDTTLPTTPATPPVLQRVEVPDVSPMAMQYWRDPTTLQRKLFIAGGTNGLWYVDLCDSLFLTTPQPCTGPVEPVQSFVDAVDIAPNAYRWKRCVDLCIVEGNAAAGAPLLVAVFAASSNPAKSAPGGYSEVRAYRILPTGAPAFYSAYMFPGTGSSPQEKIATAIANAPNNPNRLYVALGTDWVWGVNITTSTFSAARLSTPPGIPLCCTDPIAPSCSPCTYGEAARDVAATRTASGKTFVYAALEYGRVLEYQITNQTVIEYPVECKPGERSRLVRLDATSSGDVLLLNLALQVEAPAYSETKAPYRPTGFWNDICFGVGVVDQNDPGAGNCEWIRFLMRDANTALPFELVFPEMPDKSLYWGTLVLRESTPPGGELEFRSYASASSEGTVIHRLYSSPQGPMGPGMLPSLALEEIATYSGPAFAAADGVASLNSSGMTWAGHDSINKTRYEGRQVQVTFDPLTQRYDLVPVTQTVSVCPTNQDPIAPIPDNLQPPNVSCPDGVGSGDPNPFIGAAPGSIVWRHATNGDYEWYMGGRDMWQRAMGPLNCDPFGNECNAHPCLVPQAWRKDGFSGSPDVGWILVLMKTAGHGATLLNGVNLDMKFWQFQSPVPTGAHRTEDIPYLHTEKDLRLEQQGSPPNPPPATVVASRSGTDNGLRVFRSKELTDKALASCITSTSYEGYGENLAAVEPIQFLKAVTHIEINTQSIVTDCLPFACGNDPNVFRGIQNLKCHVFEVTSGDSQVTNVIAAVAAGHSVSKPHAGQQTGCVWLDTYGKPMVMFYDITPAPGNLVNPPPPDPNRTDPIILKMGIGNYVPSNPAEGTAFAVRTKAYGSGPTSTTYAFVADFMGSLLVFDVSYGVLFGALPPQPPWSPTTPNLVITEVARLEFPTDPYDGKRPNATDIEIDGNYAYVVLSRGGVAVVDISVPANPTLHTIIDTPGFAQGIFFWDEPAIPTPKRRMLQGDGRAGIRMYRAPGQ